MRGITPGDIITGDIFISHVKGEKREKMRKKEGRERESEIGCYFSNVDFIFYESIK